MENCSSYELDPCEPLSYSCLGGTTPAPWYDNYSFKTH
jgi:hypothetical protein